MDDWFRFVLGALAVWRVTHLLNAEDGPWDIFIHLRRKIGEGFWGALFDCFYCLSLWIAAPFAFVVSAGWLERVLAWLALSGAAILLERVTAQPPPPTVVRYMEGDSTDDELLRR